MSTLSKDNASWGNAMASGWGPSSMGNPNLKWESTETKDFGIDFSGFNNRFQVNLDYFINTTDNLLFSVPIPNTTGFSSYTTNLGSVRNEGWEIDLTTHNLTGNFKWNTSVNLSRTRNEVLDMGDITKFTSSKHEAYFITRVGGPVSQFYCYRTNGLLTSEDFDSNKKALVPIVTGEEAGNVRIIDQTLDGKITSDDYVPYGSNIPDLIYGLTNTFQWKNFRVSVLCQGQIGGDVCFLGLRQMDVGYAGMNQLADWVRCWKPDYEALYGPGENPIPDIEGVDMTWNGKKESPFGKIITNTDRWIYDASFFRIKNVTLSYNLSKEFAKKIFLNSVRIYASADNLKTFDNYPGYTPETNSYGNSTTQAGVDYATYPLSRKYTLGVNITF